MPPLDQYAAEFGRSAPPKGGQAWLAGARERALERFLSLGFPTTHDEEWRFTSVAPIAERPFALAPAAPPAGARARTDLARLPEDACELVFVNGRYAPTLSRTGAVPEGVRVGSLAEVLASRPGEVEPFLGRLAPEGQAFTELNTAFLADGAYVHVPAGTVVRTPIHLIFLSAGDAAGPDTMAHPRVLAVVGTGGQATIVESYAGADGRPYFTNAVTEIVLGDEAVLDHYKLQREGAAAFHVGSMHVRAGRGASAASHSISLGGALVRNDAVAVLDGEGGHCTLNGLYLADGDRLVDNHTTIDHAKPHCDSREAYSGILADRARGVFNGKIVVRPDAQKTDAKQTNRALLLSEDARINTKPQLEIFADDVRCTHGAAVGQLDEEAIFYLRSRGLTEPAARRMLVRAFAMDVLGRMAVASLREGVEDVLLRQLARALPVAA